MSEKDKSTLVIKIGAIHLESDAPAGVENQIVAGFLNTLRAIRDDLNSKGIETTVIVAGVPLDDHQSK